VLLYWSLRGVEWSRVWQTVSAARWRYLAAAAAITCCSYFLRAIRWRILLNAEGRLGVGTVFCANMAGYLGNNFLPARAGEILRTVLISRRSPLSKTFVLTTALAERAMDVIAVVLLAALALLGVEAKPKWMADLSRSLTLVACAAAAATAILPHTGDWVERLLRALPLPPKIADLLCRLAGQVLAGLRSFHNGKRLAGFALLTALIWGCDTMTMLAASRALGLAMTAQMAMLLLTGMALGSSLPSTPGYVGIYQFVAVTVLVPFGIGRDDALAFILVAQALGYVVVVMLGLPALYWLRKEEAPAAVSGTVAGGSV
jgi:uncharacterized protein (TIRG00374 family)